MDDYRDIVNDIKRAISIADVIREDEPLQDHGGRYVRGTRHDSLVVDTRKGSFHWNSHGEEGDVITWLKLHRGMDFKTAVEYLAQCGGMEPPRWRKEDLQARLAARARYDALTVAARFFVRTLRNNADALCYCELRGWTEETIRKAGIGYWNGDKGGLRDTLRMHDIQLTDPAVKALMGMPSGSPYGYIIYPHVEWGVAYLTLRLAYKGDKKTLSEGLLAHYNLPFDLVGERKPLWNWVAIPGKGPIVIVEGQADAITLAQWNVPAVAIAGIKLIQTMEGRRLLLLLSQHDPLYVGLDQDDAGATGARALAEALSPTIHVAIWPDHDVNDWLCNTPTQATAENIQKLLKQSSTYIELLSLKTGQLTNSDRQKGLRYLFKQIIRMDDFTRDVMRSQLAAAAGLKLREFDRLLKATEKEEGGAGGETKEPLITISLPGGLIETHLVETLYEPPDGSAGATTRNSGKSLFAVRMPDGDVQTVKSLDVNGVRYIPPSSENPILIEGVVRFAPRVGKLLSTREMVREVQHTIHKYMDVDIFYETLSAYYVIFTWLYDSFNTLPYLRVLGDAGTGKSRFLQVVGSLCYRPIIVTGAATTSPIFRLLDHYRGTLIIDEADFGKSDASADIIKIFNTGYQRAQGIVLRAGPKENNFEPEVYVVYGPKILSTRKKFTDWALESRCLTKEMGGPTTRGDIPIELPRDFWTEEIPHLQSLLLRYRMEHWKPEMELDYDQLDPSIEPRLNQVMLSLVSIVDDVDLKEDLRGFMRKYNEQLISERGLTLTAKVLEAIVAQWQIESDMKDRPEDRDVSLKTIAHRCDQLMDYENLDEDEEYTGRRLTGKKVGDIARKQLHLQTRRSSQHGSRYVIVWHQTRINALRGRYGMDDDRLQDVINIIFAMDVREQEQKQAKIEAAQRGFGGA